MENLNNVDINVTQSTKDTVEALFWILGENPKDISKSSCSDGLTIFNHKTNKRLRLQVKKDVNNDKSETIKNCHTCLDFNGSCEHGPVSRCGCSTWVGSF